MKIPKCSKCGTLICSKCYKDTEIYRINHKTYCSLICFYEKEKSEKGKKQ